MNANSLTKAIQIKTKVFQISKLFKIDEQQKTGFVNNFGIIISLENTSILQTYKKSVDKSYKWVIICRILSLRSIPGPAKSFFERDEIVSSGEIKEINVILNICVTNSLQLF